MEKFYEAKPLEIAENFKLMQRKQAEDESIQEFATALRKLSLNCELGDQTDKIIRNFFVMGIRNKRTQNRLLETPDLTFEKAIQIATAMELSEKETCRFQGEKATALVSGGTRKKTTFKDKSKKSSNTGSKSNFTKKNTRVNNITCLRCGRDHYASECTLDKSIKCLSCGKTGHIKRVCKSRACGIKTVECHMVDFSRYRKRIHTTLNVNDKDVQFEVDSGSAVTLMSESQAKTLFKDVPIQNTDLNLVTYTRTPVPLLEYITVRVRNSSFVRKLHLYIAKVHRGPIVGREWISQLDKVQILSDSMSKACSTKQITECNDSKVRALLKDFPTITIPSVDKISNVRARLNLKPKVNPVFLKTRMVPFRLRDKIEKELEELVHLRILEKYDYSDWATPIVPVLKKMAKFESAGIIVLH